MEPPVRLASTGTIIHGVSVGEVLGVSTLAEARLIAGESGLGRIVQRLNVMEVPDILPWVKPHELLLTTGFPLRAVPGESDDVAALCRLVSDLNERRLAAIAIKLGRYIDRLPDAVLHVAERLDLPLLRVPDSVAFDDVITDVFTELLDRQAGALSRADELHRALAAIVLEGGDLPQIADELLGTSSRASLIDAAR